MLSSPTEIFGDVPADKTSKIWVCNSFHHTDNLIVCFHKKISNRTTIPHDNASDSW